MSAAALRVTVALALAGLVCGPARAMDIALTGGWSVAIGPADLASGAGSDLRGHVDSTATEVLLDISLTTGNADAWRVDVRRIDSLWDAGLHLWVRRAGEGSGTGTILDGLGWVEIGVTNTPFFEGSGDRDDVPVQLRLTGLALGVSPEAYLASLQYTIVDSP